MKKLFDENLGIAKNKKELSLLKKQFSSYDPMYVGMSTIPHFEDARKWIEDLWTLYESYADKHFLQEFKRQFTQRAWELYLGATLLNRGYLLEKHSDTGPDLKLSLEKPTDSNKLWIEAIAVEKGEKQDKVPDIEFGKAMDVPEQQMLLRLTNALTKKHKIYTHYLAKNIIGKNDPFIIAVNRSDLEHVDPGIPLILKCLFGIGHQVLSISTGKQQPKIKATESNWTKRTDIKKQTGNNVSMLFFDTLDYSGISAVIYIINNIINSPRTPKEMGEDFVIVHNPFAKNPLSTNFFPFKEQWKVDGSFLKKI